MFEEFDNKKKLAIIIVFLLSLSISGVRSLTNEHMLGGIGGDGYQEEALLIQEKILNPFSNVSLAPYKPDENRLILTILGLFL